MNQIFLKYSFYLTSLSLSLYCFYLLNLSENFNNYVPERFGIFLNSRTSIPKNFSISYKSICECKKDEIVHLKVNDEDVYSVYLSYNNKTDFLYNLTLDEVSNFNITCDLYNVLKRGKQQKVIGYSLYGTNLFYYNKLRDLTSTISKMYPGWTMRVYYDDSINKTIICEVECEKDEFGELLDNADFCYANNISLKLNNANIEYKLNGSYLHKMKWRWLPIGDSFVDIFSSRDTDSQIIEREIDSVNVWLKSNKVGHIMRGKYDFSFIR